VRRFVLVLTLALGCVPSEALDGGLRAREDAAMTDAGLPDAGPAADAQVLDVGVDASDSGLPDSSATDASQLDATAPPDAGLPDAGSPDVGAQSCELAGVNFTCESVEQCTGVPLFGRCGPQLSATCCLDQAPCSVDGASGLCLDVALCPGTSTPGRCPGAAEIQCCTDPQEACDPNSAPTPNVGLVETSLDPRCPDGMVVADAVCIDRFEAALVRADGSGPWSPYVNPGSTAMRAVSLAYAIPQGYISGVQAAEACNGAGKRLCTDAEWLSACQGPGDLTYPYGPTRQPGRCNDARGTHPAYEYFGTTDNSVFSMLDHRCLNQLPAGLALTGQHAGCESPAGTFDMMGNLHEWTSAPQGTFRGGFYVDTRINGNGCQYRTTAHDRDYWDYSTGFRCCAALR
jgi:sulfatase modifying factor 1